MPRLLQVFFLLGIATVDLRVNMHGLRSNTGPACTPDRWAQSEDKLSDRSNKLIEPEPVAVWQSAIALLPNNHSTWQAALARLTQKDLVLAFRNATQLVRERPELAQIAYGAILDTLAQDGNYADARRVLEQISSGEIKDHLITNLALQWGRDDPLSTAEWLLTLSTDVDRVPAFTQLGRAWAEVQPQEAVEVLFLLPAGELRRCSLTAALSTWIDANPASASAWLAQREPHPDLDLVAARIARGPSLVRAHVEAALGWAEIICDANERVQTLGSIVIQWADTDRASAIRYVQNAPNLSSAQRATLLEDIGSERGVL